MNKRTPTVRKQSSDSARQMCDLIKHGLDSATKMSPTGWVALVSIIALLVVLYAMHALLAVAMKL
jgi:hypothetical protein